MQKYSKVFVIHLRAFSLKKDEKEITEKSRSFCSKKLNNSKIGNPKRMQFTICFIFK